MTPERWVKYRFLTSLGYVYLNIDLSKASNQTLYFPCHRGMGSCDGRTSRTQKAIRLEKFEILEGKDLLVDLFDCVGIEYVHVYNDGSMWVNIDMGQFEGGSPEYLLEPVKDISESMKEVLNERKHI